MPSAALGRDPILAVLQRTLLPPTAGLDCSEASAAAPAGTVHLPATSRLLRWQPSDAAKPAALASITDCVARAAALPNVLSPRCASTQRFPPRHWPGRPPPACDRGDRRAATRPAGHAGALFAGAAGACRARVAR